MDNLMISKDDWEMGLDSEMYPVSVIFGNCDEKLHL